MLRNISPPVSKVDMSPKLCESAVAKWGDLTHAICAERATNCGCWLYSWLPERKLTAMGGGLFLLFGRLAAI